LRFKAHPRHLLKIKSQFGQNTQHNLCDSIILLSYFNAIALTGECKPVGLITVHHLWLYPSEACETARCKGM